MMPVHHKMKAGLSLQWRTLADATAADVKPAKLAAFEGQRLMGDSTGRTSSGDPGGGRPWEHGGQVGGAVAHLRVRPVVGGEDEHAWVDRGSSPIRYVHRGSHSGHWRLHFASANYSITVRLKLCCLFPIALNILLAVLSSIRYQ